MTDIKDLKSIDLSSMTIIGTSINFIWGIIVAIFLLMILTIASGSININLIIMAVAIIFAILVFSIPKYFGASYLFNILIGKLKEINLEIVDMEKITNISTISLALICSIIVLIVTIIVYPITLIGISLISPLLQLLAVQGAIQIVNLLYYILMFIASPLIIVFSFVVTFIVVAVATFLFNIINPKLGGLKLSLSKVGTMTQLDSLNSLNVGLISGIISAIFGLAIGLIFSILAMNLIGTLLYTIYLIIIGFVGGFIFGAVTSILYNFLAPKMGKLKVGLE